MWTNWESNSEPIVLIASARRNEISRRHTSRHIIRSGRGNSVGRALTYRGRGYVFETQPNHIFVPDE